MCERYTHELRVCLLYEYKQGVNAPLATKHLKEVFGDNALDIRTCQRWFKRFKSGDYCLEDDQRPGRPVQFDKSALLELVKTEPMLSSMQLAKRLNYSQSTVQRHLVALGITPKRKTNTNDLQQ